ncbi:nuclear transport factor 2 family protein [Streptomyces chumphonensis]|uniref:Nuclear transport factor 2 family protein n=1 Tax=Streptomyces chumphonensis TaxID=1214925 RepID=A0A927EYC4_9ACTN|nr:nuclear transport factor 2 family protein [Streptomyces chumphonensis]MBD3931012.1 nuclear transport factor 2 family protein [Streptomyces chumphonensis]
MTIATNGRPTGAIIITGSLYSEVLHFYAHQMQSLDARRFEDYAASFTESGVFRHSPHAEPAVGRPAIVQELVDFHRKYDPATVRRRHWFNQIALTAQCDGTVKSTAYALVTTIRPGERPEINPSCLVHDVLAVEGTTVRVASRLITHDHIF